MPEGAAPSSVTQAFVMLTFTRFTSFGIESAGASVSPYASRLPAKFANRPGSVGRLKMTVRRSGSSVSGIVRVSIGMPGAEPSASACA